MKYAEAVFQGRERVAGARLLPMTVGHALLLQRLGSPFSPGDRPPAEIGDCALAIEILRRPYPRAVSAANSWRIRPWLWLRWVMLSFRFQFYRWKLLSFVSNSWTLPEVWFNHAGEYSSGDPLRVIVNTLCAKLGRSAHDAMNTPLKQALWDVCEYWRQEGAIRFATPDEEELLAELRKGPANG